MTKPQKLLLLLGPSILIAALAFALRRNDPPAASTPPAKPATAKSFHERHERDLLKSFTRALEEDPTLAPTMLSLTRESVMSMTRLTPDQRQDLWTHIEKLQAEARRAPRQEIFEVSGDN